MSRTSSDQDRLRRLLQAITAPPSELKIPEDRHRARLLNGILVFFIPLSLIVLVIQLFVTPLDYVGRSKTILAITLGISATLLIYLINHTQYYRITHYFALGLGFIVIFVNAISSMSPHLEIAYLVMLPMMGMLILSFKETIILSALTIVGFLAFVALMGDIPPDIFKDILTFLVFVQTFILFFNRERNRLEADRQKLAIEQERNAVLKQLITNLSHDFRTPLSVIITSVFLLEHIQDPARQQAKRELIHRQALRLNRMIDDILTMSALDQSVDQHLEERDINELLHTLHQQFYSQAQQKAIQLHLDLCKDLEPVWMDYDNLQRAIANLVENAVNYTGPGGQITLRSRLLDRLVIVEIADTGIGIAPQDLPAIFTPFFRADITRPTHSGGMGLGLAIAKRVVDLHGGTIMAESVLGQGSTFRIHMPITRAKS